jgi:hypothetical protein
VSPMTNKQTSEANGTSAQAAQEWARQTGQYLRARQVATQAQLAPLAASARLNAQQGLLGARTWTAPQLDRMALTLQERLAPQAIAALSAAARRIEPAPPPPPPRRRWPAVLAGIIVIAGGCAAAVYLLNKRNGNSAPELDEADDTSGLPATEPEMAAADAAGADGQTQAP